MRALVGTIIRAIIILAAASCIGIGLNLASSNPLPWVYEPPTELTLEGVKIPLIDEKEARKRFNDPNTVFIDTRDKEEYSDGHVKSALFLPAHEKEEQFQSVEPLLSEEAQLILYCHGPECEMAEQVAGFLIQLGYKNLAIMTAGFPAWKKAGYPVEEPRG
jgi:rhodanese-related sulfurtransferase